MDSKINKILIANRGEIACRLFLACKNLGLKTVAVYSEADAKALHVKHADEAVCIGPGPVNESYLKIENILEAAKKTKAQAIHPGYGLLSERASFAEQTKKVGLVWIGPEPKTIELMGNKIEAKKIAEKAKVPTLPWALVSNPSEKELQKAAKKIGYPLLLKAAAGGGGRGMRLVQKESELFEKSESAIREAKGAFGSGEIFLESYCPVARHIEVQVFGDQFGNVISLGERECSAQRRHQKVIEEAPAPNLSEKTRESLWAAAVRLAKEVGYVNAGTCEFLVDEKENFYFLEMNTRLQVEHPVTELVWGIDLPCMQIRVSLGEKIDSILDRQEFKLKPSGHAIEARLYAEDPAQGFMPSPGVLEEFFIPHFPRLRVDAGYKAGDEIPPYYDAMFAKVISWGMDREQSRRLLTRALKETKIEGIRWNGNYLIDILEHNTFAAGNITTAFLGNAFANWKPSRESQPGDEFQSARSLENASRLVQKHISPWEYYSAGDSTNKTRKAKKKPSQVGAVDHDLDTGPIVSQYPGKVLKVLVEKGEEVKQGQIVVVCESMKMEFSYSAPFDTKVKSVNVSEGEMIAAGSVLVEWNA